MTKSETLTLSQATGPCSPSLEKQWGWARALVGSLCALVVLIAPTLAFAADGEGSAARVSNRDRKGSFDSRATLTSKKILKGREAKWAQTPSAAVVALREAVGNDGILGFDPLTSTPRIVARLDGFLTTPSTAPAASIAFGYVRANAAAFGLDAAAIANLRLARDYVSIDGTHHLYWLQTVNGVPVFGNGLRANVTRDGRLINVLGSPVAQLSIGSTAPAIGAARALTAARGDVGAPLVPVVLSTAPDDQKTTTFGNGDRTDLVLFQTTAGLRLGWRTLAMDAGYLHVIDAQSGAVLYRQSLVSEATGRAQDNFPNAPTGGALHTVEFTGNGWLRAGVTRLSGPNVHAYADLNDDDVAQPSEEIAPSATGNWDYGITFFNNSFFCSAAFPCTWELSAANSWETNRPHGGTNLFYLTNTFHDHLAAAPIGFTKAAGNFEDGDPLIAQDLDGAGIVSGLPDAFHLDNANMLTPPDGFSPRMQMYLWRPAFGFLFVEAMGSDDAGIVYHEYTHGLSYRLVVDPLGNSTLGFLQAGAMGEGWSDWYAMDRLVDEGSETDGHDEGDVVVGKYITGGPVGGLRFQGLDCLVGSTSPNCPGGFFTAPGGFTYADYGNVFFGPEVHADGEIWAETLWDLRRAFGSWTARSLVTRAMELSPADPSFLDMRNSILQADLVAGGTNRDAIWAIFAKRGMGYFAAAVSGLDGIPVADFSLPPGDKAKTAKLKGIVTDFDSGRPLAGAHVTFAGHASGFQGDIFGVSDPNGKYDVKKLFLGSYPKLLISKTDWDPDIQQVTIDKGDNTVNFSLRRDWASIYGGGQISDFNGPDYTPFFCGPDGAIDRDEFFGWGSDTSDGGENPFATPKFIVVRLPATINVTEIKIDPSNTCGDAGSASTKDYRVETSTDGSAWRLASEGMFGRANRRRLNSVPLNSGSTSDVRFVRFTMLNPQVPRPDGTLPPFGQNALALRCGPGAPEPARFSGCAFMDMTEIEVYGAATS